MIMNITEKIKDLFRSGKTICNKRGHSESKKQIRKILREPDRLDTGWPTYAVATKAVQTREICSRCKKSLTDWKDIKTVNIQGISMPAKDMELFEDRGWIYWN